MTHYPLYVNINNNDNNVLKYQKYLIVFTDDKLTAIFHKFPLLLYSILTDLSHVMAFTMSI